MSPATRMTPGRWGRLLATVDEAPGCSVLGRICGATTILAAVGQAQITVLTGGDAGGMAFATAGEGPDVARLAFALGEGPPVDAHRLGRAVLAPDLAMATSWTVFAREAGAAGIAAAFAFPIQVGRAGIGVLSMSRVSPGRLSSEAVADAHGLAEMAVGAILGLQAEAPHGRLHTLFANDPATQWQTHQATGMVAAQAAISVVDALVRLRAHAFALDRPLTDVASDVVARRLRFDE